MPRGETPTGKATLVCNPWLNRYIVVPPANQTLPLESRTPPAFEAPASKLMQAMGAPAAVIAERLPPVCALANQTLSAESMLISTGELMNPPVPAVAVPQELVLE